MDMPDKIQVLVGERMRVIDHDFFLEVHQQLADYYRGKGLTGHALDVAIVAELPRRLAAILDGRVYH
jgi:hypothetical protein